jgi:hypothetical protein
MTQDEIMKMDGQDLCTWLNERSVFSETNETIRQFYTNGSPIKWNLPACAFAAMKWCVDNCRGINWVRALLSVQPIPVPANIGMEAQIQLAFNIHLEDWLLAAVMVIEDMKRKEKSHD